MGRPLEKLPGIATSSTIGAAHTCLGTVISTSVGQYDAMQLFAPIAICLMWMETDMGISSQATKKGKQREVLIGSQRVQVEFRSL